MNFKRNSYLILIILIAFILRFYQLGKDPPSLYVDEVSLGYNAYSILKTARDEYGKFMPIFFRSFDTYNPGVSVYTLVPSVAVFGLNEVGVRFPAALFGLISVIISYFIVGKLFNGKKIALLATLLLAISPWHIQFSRFYHEANLMVTFCLLALLFLLNQKKQKYFIYLSAISLALAAYTFHGAKLYVPLFALITAIYFKKDLIKNKKQTIIAIIILALSTLPVLFSWQNAFSRANSVSIFNQKDNAIQTFINGYLFHFSPIFLFAKGDSIGRHSVPGMGEHYVFEIPFIVLGLLSLIRNKSRSSKFVLAWFLIGPIPASLATPAPHAGRALGMEPVIEIILAMGMLQLENLEKRIRYLAIFIIVVISFYNIFTYLHLYYSHYPKEKALDWSDGYKNTVLYIKDHYSQYETIAIDKYWGQPYIYVLFYLKFDPAEYQKQSQDKNKFDKFVFYSGNPQTQGKSLLLAPEHVITTPTIEKFRMTNNDVLFEAHEQ